MTGTSSCEAPATGGHGRKVAIAFGAVAAVLSVLVIRVYVESRSEVLAGNDYAAAGDMSTAIARYGRAVHWYLPGNGWVTVGYDRLWGIATAAEASGDIALALEAYREVRRGVHSTRSLYFPHEERLHAANEKIAKLMSEEPPPPVDAGKDKATLRAEHLELLNRDLLPDPFWSVIVLIGFFGWIGGLGLLIWRGFDSEGLLKPRSALLWGSVAISAAALWIVGMTVA